MVGAYEAYESENKVLINSENIDQIFGHDIVFIDGLNEFTLDQLDKIISIILNSENVKYITTSWFTIDIVNIETQVYFMESNVDIPRLLKRIEIDYKIEQESKHILATLTYRQIVTLLTNTTPKTMSKNLWDTMQKAYENIIHKLNIGTCKGSRWKTFKDEFVINNKDFPFISPEKLTSEWREGLIKFNVIQKSGDKYFINNQPFLISIIIRDYIDKEDTDWIPNFISKYSSDILTI